MKVKFIWKDCDFLHGEWVQDQKVTSYWVEIEPDEVEKILKHVSDRAGMLEEINEQKNDSGKNFFLISKDLKSIVSMPEHYPYSGQWGAHYPFDEIPTVEINELAELQDLA